MAETRPHPSVEARRVRSFVRREGRLTRGQQRALEQLWPRYGVDVKDADVPLDLAALFGREAPVTLEIGFGDGESLAAQAERAPERDFLGIEVHRPGVGHLLHEIERRGLGNVRVASHDAVEVLERWLPPASLDTVQVFFPDPWHKKRHHKRRLIQGPFVERVATRLHTGGWLHIATDWDDYAAHIQAVLAAATEWFRAEGVQPLPGRPERRPETKFERRGRRLGHRVHDFLYRRAG